MLTIENGGAVFEYCCACAIGINISSMSSALVVINAYLLVIIFDIELEVTGTFIKHTLFIGNAITKTHKYEHSESKRVCILKEHA
ncbi:hypothetical protein JCM14467A_26090 [Vulcanisaeta sp. JCM 14467]